MDWYRVAIDFWSRLDVARPDLTRAASDRERPRGIDVYPLSTFWPVLGTALAIFSEAHGRLPWLGKDAETVDHYFMMKFLAKIPILPNPASKLSASKLLGFDPDVRIPRRFGIGQSIPDNDAAPPGRYWLKLDLGNGGHRQVDWPPQPAERAELECWAAITTRQRYGWNWGEWWYSIGPQQIFLEEDLSAEIASGYELKVIVRQGRPAWLMALLYKEAEGHRNISLRHFLPDGTEVIGETGYGKNGPMFSNSFELPETEGRDVAIAAAARIGKRFENIRVDFYLPGHGRPILGEISLCQSNARLAMRPSEFDLALRQASFE